MSDEHRTRAYCHNHHRSEELLVVKTIQGNRAKTSFKISGWIECGYHVSFMASPENVHQIRAKLGLTNGHR